MLSVDIPQEPPDRSVVLDRHALAWQRRAGSWFSTAAGYGETTWPHLLVDRGPLTPLITEAEEQGDGWQRAGFTDASCERFVQAADPDDLGGAFDREGVLDAVQAAGVRTAPEVVTRRSRAYPGGDEG